MIELCLSGLIEFFLASGCEQHMCHAVATVVVSMLTRMGKDDLADDKDPGIFSWLTGVHLSVCDGRLCA